MCAEGTRAMPLRGYQLFGNGALGEKQLFTFYYSLLTTYYAPRPRSYSYLALILTTGALGEKLLDAIVHLLNGRRCSALGRLIGCLPPPPSEAPLQQEPWSFAE